MSDEDADRSAVYASGFIHEYPGNVFRGQIVKVVPGMGTDIITIRLDPSHPIELTIAFTPVPPRDFGGGQPAPLDEMGLSGDVGGEGLGANSDIGLDRRFVKVYVPVPMGFVVRGH